jgi:hypothetical protein
MTQRAAKEHCVAGLGDGMYKLFIGSGCFVFAVHYGLGTIFHRVFSLNMQFPEVPLRSFRPPMGVCVWRGRK